MKLYPAIDIKAGRAVRLLQGDYELQTVYELSPVEAARRWISQGASQLHVVDLDGAREGRPVSLNYVEEIAGLGVPVQLGGGLRKLEDLKRAFEAGVERAIIGTSAFSDPDFLRAAVTSYRDRVLVSIDVRAGLLAVAGWVETSTVTPAEAVERLQLEGVRCFIYTSVGRDGTMEGPDLGELTDFGSAVEGTFIYAGGIGGLDDLGALVSCDVETLEGVIVGKALYEKRFTVAEALEVLA